MNWTNSERTRRAHVMAGRCVVANVSESKIKPGDVALVAWARDSGCFVYIGDRVRWRQYERSDWYNRYKVEKWGRETAIEKYRNGLLQSGDLLGRIGELRGKVLGCWCHPLPCHGDILCELANREPI